MSVEYKGKEYSVKKKGRGESSRITLDLSGKGITDISEIKGLETLTDLNILKLNNNNIHEIKRLETLKNLIRLNLKNNQITEIKGLENLINLEELTLENNQIVIIKGLDTLENLHTLNLFGNRITQVESFQNKEKLTFFLFSGNPLYHRVKNTFSSTSPQKLMEFTQMSETEKYQAAIEASREKIKKRGLERERKIKEDKKNKQVRVVMFLVGFILLLLGVPLGMANWAAGITMIVIGFILLVIASKGGICLYY